MEDRLSALPNDLISRIFWLLPMSEVVGTSILSKRWKDLWTTIPFLNFENHNIEFHKTDELRRFVSQALIHWKGERVQKFKFESSTELKKLIYAYLDLWVCFAMDHQVEELYLHMLLESYTYEDYDPKDKVYSVPQCLYTPWSSLKELSFKHCEFKVTQNVQWNQLKRLTITQGLGLTKDVVDRILAGSPELEVMVLSFVESCTDLTIKSKSLKELSIHKYLFDRSDLTKDSVLEISAPKLENLRVEGTPYGDCLLDVASLTHATLGFSGLHDNNWDENLGAGFEDEDEDEDVDEDEDEDEDKHETFSGPDFVGGKISQILQTFQFQLAVNVTLSCCFMKVLGAIERKSFPNVKLLKIGYCNVDIEQLIGLLEIFPQLKRLILQHKEDDCDLDYEKDSINFDATSYLNLQKTFLLHLRTFDVTWAKGDNIFSFLEVFFKYAKKLENMVFRVQTSESSGLKMASEKLKKIQSSFPSCKIRISM